MSRQNSSQARCHASCHEVQSRWKFALNMIKQTIQYSFSLISLKTTGPFQGIVRSKEKKNRQERSETYPYCLSSHAQSSLASYFALHDSLRDTGLATVVRISRPLVLEVVTSSSEVVAMALVDSLLLTAASSC